MFMIAGTRSAPTLGRSTSAYSTAPSRIGIFTSFSTISSTSRGSETFKVFVISPLSLSALGIEDRPARSFRLERSARDQRRQHLCLRFNKRGELLGRSSFHVEPELREALLDLGAAQQSIQLSVQFPDNRARHPRGSDH